MADLPNGKFDEKNPLLAKQSGRHEAVSHLTPSQVLRARVVTILVPVFLQSIVTTQSSLLAQYLVDRLSDEAGVTNRSHFDHCDSNNSADSQQFEHIQTRATQLLTNYGFAQCIPSFFACLLIGSYSDYFGRKIPLTLVVFAGAVKMIVITVVIGWKLNLNFMYLGFLVDGCCGSWFSMFIIVCSITSDITDGNEVQSKIFWILLINSTSSVVTGGTGLGDGLVIDAMGYFKAALFLSAMVCLAFFATLWCPDTLRKDRSPQANQLNPFVHARRMFGIYTVEGSLRKRLTLNFGLLTFFFVLAGEVNAASLDALYQLHKPFCWDATQIGAYQAVRFGATNFVTVFWLLLWRCCVQDETVAFISILFQTASYTLENFVENEWQFYIIPALIVPLPVYFSIVRGLLSDLVSQEQQGAIYSSIAVIEALCQLVATTAFNGVYGATNSSWPGLVFIVEAGCSVIGAIFYTAFSFAKRDLPTEEFNTSLTVNVHPVLGTDDVMIDAEVVSASNR